MLNVRAFSVSDLDSVGEWYHKRNLEAPTGKYLPTIGYIVPNVAAGFLFATDTRVCMLDGYITNPDVPSYERHVAIAAVTGQLLEAAKAQGFEQIMVFSKEQDIIARAREMKFSDKGDMRLLTKDI